jgi:hypothetical protein
MIDVHLISPCLFVCLRPFENKICFQNAAGNFIPCKIGMQQEDIPEKFIFQDKPQSIVNVQFKRFKTCNLFFGA